MDPTVIGARGCARRTRGGGAPPPPSLLGAIALVAAVVLWPGAGTQAGALGLSARSAATGSPAAGGGADTRLAVARTPRAPGGPGRPLDSATFADGSCTAFPPTEGNRHQTVFLDAGHGGIDPGGVGTTESGATITEAQETLPVELDAMAILRARGYRVVVSRTTDNTVARLGPADVSDGLLSLAGVRDDVAARAQCANDAGAAALVGIYFDAGDSADQAGSLTAYDAARPFAAANLKLAQLVQDNVLYRMDAQDWAIPDDGVQNDVGLGSLPGDPALGGLAARGAAYDHLMLLGPAMAGYFTTPSEMPGAIIEPLYLTDPFEGSIAAGAPGQRVIAEGIAAGVQQFLAAVAPQRTGESRS